MVSCFGIGTVASMIKQLLGAVVLVFAVAFFSKWWWYQSYAIDDDFWFVVYLSGTIFIFMWFTYCIFYIWWECRKCKQREAYRQVPVI